jgi:outer membrane protein assembly factor BamA
VRKVRGSFRALYRTGLFRRVSIELAPGGGAERELLVVVEELPSTELFVEPGFGSYEGLRFLLGARETNLLGRGRGLHGEALLAQRAQRLVGGVRDPRLFGTRVEGSLSLFREVRDEPSFDKDERGLAVTLSRELRPRVRVSTEYRFRVSEISDVDFSDPIAVAALQDVDISSVALAGSYDSRDSLFLPTRGHSVKLSFELGDEAIGSELDFSRVKLTHASFFDLRPGTVVGLSYRTGVIAPLEDTDTIPIQERFFNGGENTVRSFREKELGPVDSAGEPLGGEVFNVISAELRQRLRGNFEAAAFYDTGNVDPDADDFLRFRDFRHGLGLGLRYLLPIGPLRLDAAWNPDRRADEEEWVAHFSVGASF